MGGESGMISHVHMFFSFFSRCPSNSTRLHLCIFHFWNESLFQSERMYRVSEQISVEEGGLAPKMKRC